MNFFSPRKSQNPSFGGRRAPRFAGTWYQNNPEKLKSEIEEYLQNADPKEESSDSKLLAIVSPHAGFMYSGPTAAFAFKKALANKKSIKRILLLGPSHYANFRGIALSSFSAYGTPLGDLPVDIKAVKELSQNKDFQFADSVHEKEHSLEMQTSFIRHIFGEIEMIPLVVGTFADRFDVQDCASKVRNICRDTDLIVVSSDFTHYGPRYDYVPFYDNISQNIQELDFKAFSYLEQPDLEGFINFQKETECTICGFYPLSLMLGILPDDTTGNLLHYQTSRNQGSDDSLNSVSYLALSFSGESKLEASTPELSEKDKSTLLKLARSTAGHFTRTGKRPRLDQLPSDLVLSDLLRKPMGVFVTLFLKDPFPGQEDLRGCIGYILPVKPLFEAVMDNAVGACSKDYRFAPVKYEELSAIRIEISVLTPPKPTSSYNEIEIGKHGVVLDFKGKQSVFLPHVATEYGWTRDETLRQLSLKAGLNHDAWQQKGAKFEIFESVMFEESHEEH